VKLRANIVERDICTKFSSVEIEMKIPKIVSRIPSTNPKIAANQLIS
jgi:hypothetical protein